MPELPEVEAARRAIEAHCLHKKITKCIVADDPKVIDSSISPSSFQSTLTNKTILSANRKGKNLWLHLDSPPFPSFQFGMTGAIYIKGVAVTKYKRSAVSDTDEWPSKYSKVFIQLEDGVEFSFTDKRRFARVKLLDDPVSVPPISELGPDAFTELMEVDEFAELLRKKKIAIKTLLLDQSFISGIGNWVADEVLYQARIHPLQIAGSLSKESCESLHRCIREVIGKAVEVGADSSQYPDNWIFHSREKKPGKAFVDGKKIEFITAGGRTSAFVPELQKLTGTQTQKKAPLKKSRKTQRGKDSSDEEELNSEEGTKGKPKLKKSENTAATVNKRQKKASQDDSDDNEEVSKKPAKGAAKKQKMVTRDPSKKKAKPGEDAPKQKKARK